MIFPVINDNDIKMPKKIQKMLNKCKMDDDNDTTDSLIDRAINKNMENLCFSLKKIKKSAHDFNFYLKKRQELSDFTSEESSHSRRRKGSWTTSEEKKESKQRTRSLKTRRVKKIVSNKRIKSKSIGRL